MAAFRFPLETPLKLRRHAEEQASLALAETMRRLEAKQAQMLDLREQLTGSVEGRKEALLAGNFLPQMQMVDMGWFAALKMRMAACHGEIQAAQAEVDAARGRLVEARRAVKVLETLRERREKQWRQAENRRTENILSDMAGVNWLRQAREEAERRQSAS